MGEVRCGRCEATAEGLEKAPLPGEDGERILAGVCGDCWREWLGEQVKLINELRLSPADPGQYDLLLGRMREYLKLGQ